MRVKYFADEYKKVRSALEDTGTEYTYFSVCPTGDGDIVAKISRLTGNILYTFPAYDSLLELEWVGYNTTPFRMKKFLKDLTHLNENSTTIGAGRLAQIKSEAAYFLDRLNKE